MKSASSQHLAALIVLLLLVVLIFSGMAGYRMYAYGEIRTAHAWFSDLTMQFARNWHRDGVVPLRGAMFWRPASAEFPDLPSRRMHSSYPSGMLLPVYGAALLTFAEPGPGHVLFANMFCHFMLIVCCALIMFRCVLQARGRPVDACVFACVPVVLLSFLPAPFYYFDKCYFAYEAVLPLVGAYMLLELLRETFPSGKAGRLVCAAQHAIAFLGTFTEWLFPLFGAVVFMKRLFACEFGRRPAAIIGNAFLFGLPFALALLFFTAQVLCLGGTEYIQDRFLLRTGMSQDSFLDFSSINPFWQRHILPMYGYTGIIALAISFALLVLLGVVLLVFRILRHPAEPCLRTTLWMGIACIFACTVHVELLRNQSAFYLHGFEALKYSIPLALLPLALLPLSLLRVFGLNWSRWTLSRRWMPSIVPLLAVFLAVGYAYSMFPDIEKRYAVTLPDEDEANIARATFLDEHTGREDIVFSSSVALVQDDSPLYAAYSMKLVYEAHSLYDVYDKVRPVEGEYALCFFNPVSEPPPDPALAELVSRGEAVGTFEDNTLKRVSKEIFMSVYNTQ